MTYTFQTEKKPCAMQLRLQSSYPRRIFVTGYDSSNNDPYFRRICELTPGKLHTFFFGMPLSPKQLKVQVFDQDNRILTMSQTFQLEAPKIVGLRTSPLSLDQDSANFLHFAEQLAVQMPELKTGGTYEENGFEVDLYSDLPTSTPARIESNLDYIEVSKVDFLKMTVPRRVLILLHEFSHNFLNGNPESEIEADIHALSIYLSRGYPFMEGIYAFTKILHDNQQSMERLEWMHDFMIKHQLYIDN